MLSFRADAAQGGDNSVAEIERKAAEAVVDLFGKIDFVDDELVRPQCQSSSQMKEALDASNLAKAADQLVNVSQQQRYQVSALNANREVQLRALEQQATEFRRYLLSEVEQLDGFNSEIAESWIKNLVETTCELEITRSHAYWNALANPDSIEPGFDSKAESGSQNAVGEHKEVIVKSLELLERLRQPADNQGSDAQVLGELRQVLQIVESVELRRFNSENELASSTKHFRQSLEDAVRIRFDTSSGGAKKIVDAVVESSKKEKQSMSNVFWSCLKEISEAGQPDPKLMEAAITMLQLNTDTNTNNMGGGYEKNVKAPARTFGTQPSINVVGDVTIHQHGPVHVYLDGARLGTTEPKEYATRQHTPKSSRASHISNGQPKKYLSKEQIRDQDVIKGRGGLTNKHDGNAWYRCVGRSLGPIYSNLSNKMKSEMSKEVIKAVHERGGRFVDECDDQQDHYVIVEDRRALTKVGQYLRDNKKGGLPTHMPEDDTWKQIAIDIQEKFQPFIKR